MPAGCVTRHSETSQEDTHRRKVIFLPDVPRDILKYHEKRHTGEKTLYLQDVSKDTLKHHEKIHTEEKPFACTMFQVNEFPSEVSFSILKCHEKIHTGEKPFACGICNETFVNRNNQKFHAKIHTG